MLPEYLHNVSFSNEVPSGAQFLSWITFQDFLLLNLDVLTNSRVPDLFLLKFLDNSHPLLNTEPSLFSLPFFLHLSRSILCESSVSIKHLAKKTNNV